MNTLSSMKMMIFTLLLGVISTTTALAEDKIVFRPVAEDSESARAVCRASRRVSHSVTTKQNQRFRGFLDPHQLRDVINKRQKLRFSQLVSAANALAFGGEAFAEVQEAEIIIELKSVDGKPISSILFRWSNEDPSAWLRLSESEETLSFVDQGTAECQADGPRFASNTCLFDAENQAEELLHKHLARLSDGRVALAQKSLSQGLMIEVLYRTQSYADCEGVNAQSMVRTRVSTPILRLTQR